MKTMNPHSNGSTRPGGLRPRRRLLRYRGLALLLAALVAALAVTAHTVSANETRAPALPSSGYGWPVKPFHVPHPVRGNFGDPRTTFRGPATPETLMRGDGVFAFHFGIDVSVPDGTAVYPVASGVARLCGGRNVHVDHGGGFATQYWHIVPAVSNGQAVTAYETVLGHVQRTFEHVHFSEMRNGVFVNPLAPGHLTPYADGTRPEIGQISFRGPKGGQLLPEWIHGRVQIVVEAFDRPALTVAGKWAQLPVAPASLSWRLERVDRPGGLKNRVAFDVRSQLPGNDDFWWIYARGTRQNMPPFDGHRASRIPGVYLYSLTRTPLDSSRLATGVYRLVVSARDTAGNTAVRTQMLIIRNASR
jgi:murein DD-endopeptidase MepM/ murein hydrolase activator NlpD